MTREYHERMELSRTQHSSKQYNAMFAPEPQSKDSTCSLTDRFQVTNLVIHVVVVCVLHQVWLKSTVNNIVLTDSSSVPDDVATITPWGTIVCIVDSAGLHTIAHNHVLGLSRGVRTLWGSQPWKYHSDVDTAITQLNYIRQIVLPIQYNSIDIFGDSDTDFSFSFSYILTLF